VEYTARIKLRHQGGIVGYSGIAPLLEALRSPKARAGWVEFLNAYSPVLYQTARNCTSSNDDAADCYVNICEQLAHNQFRRLLKFNPKGNASFVTWLRVVARNLCFDWHRKQFGRLRPFKSLQGLSSLELGIYHHRFVRGASPEETLANLEPFFPGVSMAELLTVEGNIQRSLSSRQHWILSSRRAAFASVVAVAEKQHETGTIEVADPHPDQEQQVAEKQEHALLQKALMSLRAEERLLVQLRYEQDLSLDEIARLCRLGDAQRAHRKLAEILKRLRRRLR
jgi:RNA polymerase sigma factor (sigma-70 family)